LIEHSYKSLNKFEVEPRLSSAPVLDFFALKIELQPLLKINEIQTSRWPKHLWMSF